MLPFLSAKKQAGVMISKVSPAGESKQEGMQGEVDPGLLSAAEDILSAIAMKDATKLANALQAAYTMCSGGYEDESLE